MKNYLCKPAKQDKQTRILVFSLLVLAFATFFCASYFPKFKAFGQLIAAVMLVIIIQITTKYLLTDYRYGLEDGCLLLSSRQGKKEKHLGGIPLRAETKILDRAAWEKVKKSTKLSARFSYCQNLFPQKPYYLLTPDEKGFVLLTFEPDDTLLALLDEQIKSL